MKKTKEPEFCEAFGRCGACQTLNMGYEEELSLKMRKVISLLKPFGRVEEILPSPCAEDGHCHDCRVPRRSCCTSVTLNFSRIPGRITVIIVGEDLGI